MDLQGPAATDTDCPITMRTAISHSSVLLYRTHFCCNTRPRTESDAGRMPQPPTTCHQAVRFGRRRSMSRDRSLYGRALNPTVSRIMTQSSPLHQSVDRFVGIQRPLCRTRNNVGESVSGINLGSHRSATATFVSTQLRSSTILPGKSRGH